MGSGSGARSIADLPFLHGVGKILPDPEEELAGAARTSAGRQRETDAPGRRLQLLVRRGPSDATPGGLRDPEGRDWEPDRLEAELRRQLDATPEGAGHDVRIKIVPDFDLVRLSHADPRVYASSTLCAASTLARYSSSQPQRSRLVLRLSLDDSSCFSRLMASRRSKPRFSPLWPA